MIRDVARYNFIALTCLVSLKTPSDMIRKLKIMIIIHFIVRSQAVARSDISDIENGYWWQAYSALAEGYWADLADDNLLYEIGSPYKCIIGLY